MKEYRNSASGVGQRNRFCRRIHIWREISCSPLTVGSYLKFIGCNSLHGMHNSYVLWVTHTTQSTSTPTQFILAFFLCRSISMNNVLVEAEEWGQNGRKRTHVQYYWILIMIKIEVNSLFKGNSSYGCIVRWFSY